jgi:putative nucleotidyltransferase with HDIG domain
MQNSFTLHASRFTIIDLFEGQKDLKNKVIRAVGDASERFEEDALRMMRAIRFAVQLNGNKEQGTRDNIQKKENKNWEIEGKTFSAIKKNAKNLKYVSQERIRDEFDKIILSKKPSRGVELLVESKLMDQFIPEVISAIGVKQNRHHYHGPYNTVYAHMLASLEKCPSKKLEVRLASFFHDIGKPKSKRGTGEVATFYGHEYIGERMVRKILERLKYPRKVADKILLLVKNHMFYYNVEEVGEAGVRRVIRKVGLENINDLIDVRIADRLGSGVAKAVPYKLRHFKFMVEKVSADAISVKQLAIDGNDLMRDLEIQPGPKIGAILDVLLAHVIDDQTLNKKEKLLSLAKELEKKDLEELRAMAKKKIAQEKKEEEELMKKKYWVE